MLALLLPAALAAQAGSLEVRVATATGEPLAGALVTVRTLPDSSIARFADTDAAGVARIPGLPAGRYAVSARLLGHLDVERDVAVAGGEPATLLLVLRTAAVALPGVVVEAERRRARFEETAGRTTAEITQRDIKLLPAVGEADVLRAVEILPGVISTSDFSSAYNVRGGSSDQNLILLDGFPIFNPFHLGGLFSVFNSDMVARAELMSGGFPAEFGGRVSSVLAVESDAGERGGTDLQGGVSILAARMAAGFDLPDGPLAAVGLHSGRMRLSARRSYFDRLLRPFFDFPYHLRDLQGFGEAWTAGGGRVTVSGYTGRDVLDLTGVEAFPLRVRWNWGNDVAGVNWTQPVGSGTLTLRSGHTRFATAIRFPEFDDTEFRSRIEQSLLRADLALPVAQGLLLGTGVSGDLMRYDNLAQTGGTVFGGGRDRGWLAGAYMQARWSPGPWILEQGVRLDHWSSASGTTMTEVQPRLAVKRFVGNGDFAVSVAAGRYAQFLHSLRDEELPLGIDVWVLSGERAPRVRSDQLQLGVEGYLLQDWFGGVETYVRRFDGVATLNAADDPNDPRDDLLEGTGLSYGVDFHVQREGGRVRPLLTVSWLRATRTFDDVLAATDPPPSVQYAPIFDRRLNVEFVLQAMLPRQLETAVRWSLGTGLPFTRPVGAYVLYEYDVVDGQWRWRGDDDAGETGAVVLGGRNAQRYPTYHRLDAGIRRTFHRAWGSYTPYLDVVNVYDQRNVLFYFYQYGETPPTRSGVSMFPLLPTIGVEMSF